MCSTPCGITEFGTRALQQHMSPQGQCSTPCGITEFGTLVLGAVGIERDLCSTPCGITEFGTPCVTFWRTGGARCSTPCGITEFGTEPCAVSRLPQISAQRLAASLNSAPLAPERGLPGVTVLNALRHH